MEEEGEIARKKGRGSRTLYRRGNGIEKKKIRTPMDEAVVEEAVGKMVEMEDRVEERCGWLGKTMGEGMGVV